MASSLTELFSRDLITLRMERLRQHYPWLSGGLDYFEARLTQAPEDAKFAMNYVYENAQTRARAGTGDPGTARQVRHSVGATRRPLFRLRAARMATAGRVPNRGRELMPPPTDASQPRLAAGCRWGGEDRRKIASSSSPKARSNCRARDCRCWNVATAQRTFGEIIGELQKQFGDGGSGEDSRGHQRFSGAVAEEADRGLLDAFVIAVHFVIVQSSISIHGFSILSRLSPK